MRRVRNTHPGVESVNRDGIAAEQIREVDLEAIPGEVVGEKLSDIDIMMLSREMEAGGDRTHKTVLKLRSEDVGQEDDGFVLGVVDGGLRNVGLDSTDRLELACLRQAPTSAEPFWAHPASDEGKEHAFGSALVANACQYDRTRLDCNTIERSDTSSKDPT